MKKRISIILIACILAVLGFYTINSFTRVKVPQNNIAVIINQEITYIDIDKLPLTQVDGEIINGKGETKQISGDGILVRDILSGIDTIDASTFKIVANDEYAAELTKSEIFDEDKAFFLIKESEARLYVFGDSNSKRNVSNVVKIYVVY